MKDYIRDDLARAVTDAEKFCDLGDLATNDGDPRKAASFYNRAAATLLGAADYALTEST